MGHTLKEATKEWQVVQRRRRSYWGYLLVFIDSDGSLEQEEHCCGDNTSPFEGDRSGARENRHTSTLSDGSEQHELTLSRR